MCVRSCICVYGLRECDVVPRRRGAWKMWTAPRFGWNRRGGRRLMVPRFCCWGGELPLSGLTVRVCSLLPSILPSVSPHPPPPSPDQLYQHDKSLRNTGVTSLLPFLPCKAFCFPVGVLGITHTLHRLHYFSRSYLQTLPAPCHQSLPQDESAALRHCWFGKPVSGQCWAVSLFDPPPLHVLVTVFRRPCQPETLGIPYLLLSTVAQRCSPWAHFSIIFLLFLLALWYLGNIQTLTMNNVELENHRIYHFTERKWNLFFW